MIVRVLRTLPILEMSYPALQSRALSALCRWLRLFAICAAIMVIAGSMDFALRAAEGVPATPEMTGIDAHAKPHEGLTPNAPLIDRLFDCAKLERCRDHSWMGTAPQCGVR